MRIIKTDREQPEEKTSEVVEQKTKMEPSPGGKGVLSLKQVLITLLILVLVGILTVLGVYAYKRFQKSPVKALPPNPQ